MPASCELTIPGSCNVDIPLPPPLDEANIAIDLEENGITTTLSIKGHSVGRIKLTTDGPSIVMNGTVLGITTKAHFVAHYSERRLDVRLELRAGGRVIYNKVHHGITRW